MVRANPVAAVIAVAAIVADEAATAVAIVAATVVDEDKTVHPITKSKHQIGMFGTFDVWNFGDLLFPLIAEKELTERMGEVKIRPFSYYAKLKPGWPYDTTSLTELPEKANTLAGALIGGGHIIRFDKRIAPGYFPPNPSVHHPTGYWLTPALTALQQGIPVIWNAPGVFEKKLFPGWASPILEFVLKNSSYISVRDEESKTILSRYVEDEKIKLVPDTAFGISRLINQENPSDAYERLQSLLNLQKPYIVLQATESINPFLHRIIADGKKFQDFQLLVLPISPVLGDNVNAIQSKAPNLICLKERIDPLLVAELISHAEGVVGHSLHLSITALSFGVPVFRSTSSTGKYKPLSRFKTVYNISRESKDPDWYLSKLGRVKPPTEIITNNKNLVAHWDTIAEIILQGKIGTDSEISHVKQTSSSLLEGKQIPQFNKFSYNIQKIIYNNFLLKKIDSFLRRTRSLTRRFIGKE
jgi:lipopolysaccharide transport system ATP-binding protein